MDGRSARSAGRARDPRRARGDGGPIDEGVGPVAATPIIRWLHDIERTGGPVDQFNQTMTIQAPDGVALADVATILQALLDLPQVQRVTYLRLEIVGPRMISVIGDVDLTGDDAESNVAVKLRSLEALVSASPAVAGTVLSLSAPDEPSLTV